MLQGHQLKQFIDNQAKSKISIAKDLGMSKQNLFSLFNSKELTEETKNKFETYFGKKIFDQSILTNSQDKATRPEPVKEENTVSLLAKALENVSESNRTLARVMEDSFKSIQQQITSNRQDLVEIRSTVLLTSAMQESYHEYWAEHVPPKGQTPKQVISAIHKKAFAALEGKKQGNT